MQKALRLAVVTETYAPDLNGVATSLVQLVDGLLERRHQLQLIRPSSDLRLAQPTIARNNGDFEELLLPSIPVPTYPGQKMGWPALGALHRLWSRRRPDVIHIATEGPLGWAALQVGRLLKIPICTDFRTNFHTYSRHYGLGWLRRPILDYLRHFHNSAHCTLVPTIALRRGLSDQGFHNLRVVARGVDTERFSPRHRDPVQRSLWGAGDGTLVLLYVGRLAAEKNLDTLRRSFEAIRARHADVRLVLVGHGPLAEDLRQRWPEAILAGPRSGLELSTHYASADLFLFPSLTETYGNVTAEALASGLPAVAFANGAADLLIRNGVNGARVEPLENGAFVTAALELAALQAELPRLGREARRGALELGWGRVVERFEAEMVRLAATSSDLQAPVGIGAR